MKKILRFSIWSTVIIVILIAATGAILFYIWSSNLPYIGSLREYNPPIITEIFSEDGHVIGRFWNEKRIVISLEQVPKHLINAFVAAEDSRFFKHEGVDIQSIFRAFINNLVAGKIEQGGSTITQQVARDLLLKNPKKTYKRKAREAILSMQIEKNFSKEKILFLYINQPYMGHGAYGVEAAARTYFNKNAAELDLAESALLAGLPQAPSRYSPILNFEKAKARQRYVLERMLEEGFITEEQERAALTTPIILGGKRENSFEKSPYFTEHIRRYLEKEYGRDLLYGGGLRVYTTVNLAMQRSAQKALNKGLLELDKREGYRGSVKSLPPEEIEKYKQEAKKKLALNPPEIGSIVQGVVEEVNDQDKQVIISIGEESGLLPLSEMKWARKPNPKIPYYAAAVKKPGDVLKQGDVILCRIKDSADPLFNWLLTLEQEPEIQGALFSMETKTGKVMAMVGGRNFSVSQFDRATQARRQPGSAFKPIIYATALDRGMTPSTVIIDAPYISTMNPKEEVWRPKNYKEKFFGPTLLRTALIKSMNVITVKILKTIGVKNVIDYARRMGIQSNLSPDLSLALGSSGVSLKEITTAYSVFANGGLLVEPFFINRIEDRSGQIIEENQPSLRESIPKDTAYVMTDLLRGVIAEGTGRRVRALKRPAAGKTGTTNDLRDAWFIGFTPDLSTGVWVGYDDRVPMSKGEQGATAASPIWLYYMSEVLNGRPVEDFFASEDVVFAKIDAEKGLLASPYSKKTVFQCFKKGTEPKEYTPRPKTAKSGRFSQFDMGFTE
ncbi:penicillin-binding protein 1A [Thermodesulfobacteriota bacterium]